MPEGNPELHPQHFTRAIGTPDLIKQDHEE